MGYILILKDRKKSIALDSIDPVLFQFYLYSKKSPQQLPQCISYHKVKKLEQQRENKASKHQSVEK